MKFRIVFVALVVTAILISACSPQSASSDRLRVVATTTILGDVVSAIAGDLFDLRVLIPADTDPHTFEPAPQDAALISDADILVVNGLGLETFMESLFSNAGDTIVVTASDGIEPLESNEEEVDSEEVHQHDPHVWQDPTNVIIWVENIAAAFAERDPANSETFWANAEAYIADLNELDTFLMEQTSVLPVEQRVLVTDHEALGYFARRYDFEIVGVVIPSVSTVAQQSAQETAALQQAIEEHNVPAIFIGTSFNPDDVAQLASDLGIQVITIYAEALSDAAGPAPTYLEMMRYNMDAIVRALQ